MKTEKHMTIKSSVGRLIFVFLSVLLQVVWIINLFIRLNNYSTIINIISSLLAFVIVLRIYVNRTNAAFKMPWIILILVFPVLGVCIYLLFGYSSVTKYMQKKFEGIGYELYGHLKQDDSVLETLEKKDFSIANQSRYIWNYGKYPLYQNTDIEFYAEASDGFEAQIREIRKAEKFVFLEYHAIEESVAFQKLEVVLAEKVKQGVEVRILYDDVGSIGFINKKFILHMEELGISCRVFNPIVPFLNVFMNNRDHRKITVIDGKVGFTGGYNLADEYFNITHPYVYWKDTGVKLIGEAVDSLTVMFLEMWNSMKKTDDDFARYFVEHEYQAKEQGFIQPYGDSPLDDENVGENVYLNIIKNAKHEVLIATPYLIISDEMNKELGLAAKRGVDVKIITPGIPDKKMIYKVTRSYYAGLVCEGVRIYEYTPGFIHEKQVLCDEEAAVVGTINMDYRSLYHHFENGVFIYHCSAVKDIKKDFVTTLEASKEVTDQYKFGRSAVLKGTQSILRLFAPLL